MEVGRELSGVPFGVPVGVVDALSTLALRDPDRGVIFELRKALTGVEISSLKDAFGVASDSADGPRLKLEAMRGGGDPTILGVSGAFVVLVEALRVGRSGRPLVLFCLSYVMSHYRCGRYSLSRSAVRASWHCELLVRWSICRKRSLDGNRVQA